MDVYCPTLKTIIHISNITKIQDLDGVLNSMTKPNITSNELLTWDNYLNKAPKDALESIYKHISTKSREKCAWYWKSIYVKRVTSLWARGLAVLGLVLGTSAQILATLQVEAANKLSFTQAGLALIAFAGFVQMADKIFGWSSGWMRYVTTVTTMENLTRAFELEWAKYIVAKNKNSEAINLDNSDVKALFELANSLENELTKQLTDETTKWVVEFNTSINLLESLIKTQREETDKKLEAIRTSLISKESSEKALEEAKKPGAMQASLTKKGLPIAVIISIDDEQPEAFTGQMWAKLNIAPGKRKLKIETTSNSPQTIIQIIDVKPQITSTVEVELNT